MIWSYRSRYRRRHRHRLALQTPTRRIRAARPLYRRRHWHRLERQPQLVGFELLGYFLREHPSFDNPDPRPRPEMPGDTRQHHVVSTDRGSGGVFFFDNSPIQRLAASLVIDRLSCCWHPLTYAATPTYRLVCMTLPLDSDSAGPRHTLRATQVGPNPAPFAPLQLPSNPPRTTRRMDYGEVEGLPRRGEPVIETPADCHAPALPGVDPIG